MNPEIETVSVSNTEESKTLSFDKNEVPHTSKSIEDLIRNRIRNATGELTRNRIKEDIESHILSDIKTNSTDQISVSDNGQVASLNNDLIGVVPVTEESRMDAEKYIDLFIPKRNQQKGMFEMLCAFAQGNPAMGTEEIVELPKCLSYLTKRACMCDKQCFEDNKVTDFSSRCHLFDLKDLDTDVKYLDSCRRIAFKPVDGVLRKHKYGHNIERAGAVLLEDIEQVCDGKVDDISKATCDAYELREECRNDEQCMRGAIRKINCANKEKIGDIEKILGFDIPDYNVRSRRGIEMDSLNKVPSKEIGIVELLGENVDMTLDICGGVMSVTFVILALLSQYKLKDESRKITVLICLLAAFCMGLLTISRAALH